MGAVFTGEASARVRRLSWSQYRVVFARLASPVTLPRDGDFAAEFVGPAWLRWTAGPSLRLTALAGWCGKRFESGQAVNLVRDVRVGALRAALPMQPLLASSTIDGRGVVRLQYPREAGVPWRWAVDELRPLGDGGWLGMMHLELPLLRRLHFPFLLTPTERDMQEVDCVVIGSGFGGAVSALRMAEKGHSVVVLEQGRHLRRADIEAGGRSVRRLIWEPALGLRGYFRQWIFPDVAVVGGVAVGGGSQVFAGVLLRPGAATFASSDWPQAEADWHAALAPHYARAERMLGATANPARGRQDCWLQDTAQAMGAGASFDAIASQAIYFGQQGEGVDPFFGGEGPVRSGCRQCGECLSACQHGSKNSVDLNYLYLAEKKGARVVPETTVTDIEPLGDGRYRVMVRVGREKVGRPAYVARKVIVAAGVVGTVDLLSHCRDVSKSLPKISPTLGQRVRTNSESIVGVLLPEGQVANADGAAITSHFYPDAHTHITQNRFPASFAYMRWTCGPLVDAASPASRRWQTLGAMLRQPGRVWRNWAARDWPARAVMLTVMQNVDTQLALVRARHPLLPWRTRLTTQRQAGGGSLAFIPQALKAAQHLAQVTGGEAICPLLESVGNKAVTAHILGGAVVADSPERGVIDHRHEVFGYPGLYVVDGSAVPANLGVNPSLTITALAERAMSLMPGRTSSERP